CHERRTHLTHPGPPGRAAGGPLPLRDRRPWARDSQCVGLTGRAQDEDGQLMRNWFSRRRRALPEAVKKNIQSIAQLEQEVERRRSPVDRVSDAVTRFAGSVWSAAAHAALFTGWILVNTGCLPGVRPFDPYPFSFLGLAVALEAIFLT